ncbi:MAG: hypothetical protein HZB51_27195 [Chloroflexi bacterium]|nr:hypothetical protein [Chloroflexota bacterium]
MRSKMFVLAIGIAGLLGVLALLAFAYMPSVVPTVAPVNAVVQPAQGETTSVDVASDTIAQPSQDNTAAMDGMTLLDAASDADLVSTTKQGGHFCDKDSSANAGY